MPTANQWTRSRKFVLALVVIVEATGVAETNGADLPATLPELPYHLTARPWQRLELPREAYLDAIEGIARFAAKQQDRRGAIVDPYLLREHQYSTPYFAAAVGVLLHAGHAGDLREHGVRAMEHAISCLAGGWQHIPDAHGEYAVVLKDQTRLKLTRTYRPALEARLKQAL